MPAQAQPSLYEQLRDRLGRPPPEGPPPGAPAPVPSLTRRFLVFFDADALEMDDRARFVLREAAAMRTALGAGRVEVIGHSDRTGTPAYRRTLSERRARAVAAELARQGVPTDWIELRGLGDAQPLVPTAEGVAEPQNNRVEVVLG